TSVSAMGGALFHDQTADDTALLNLRFRCGGFGTVQSVGYVRGARCDATEIFGVQGALRIEPRSGVFVGNDTWQLAPDSSEADWMTRAVEREWEALRDAITNKAPLPFPPAYGRRIIEII